MKIIDENGAAIETPDLTLGHLVSAPSRWSTPPWKAWRK